VAVAVRRLLRRVSEVQRKLARHCAAVRRTRRAVRRSEHRGQQRRARESACRDATAARHRRGAWATGLRRPEERPRRAARSAAAHTGTARRGSGSGEDRGALYAGRMPRLADRDDTRRLRSAPMCVRVLPRAYVRPRVCAARQQSAWLALHRADKRACRCRKRAWPQAHRLSSTQRTRCLTTSCAVNDRFAGA
jgi:hypothetical protein